MFLKTKNQKNIKYFKIKNKKFIFFKIYSAQKSFVTLKFYILVIKNLVKKKNILASSKNKIIIFILNFNKKKKKNFIMKTKNKKSCKHSKKEKQI